MPRPQNRVNQNAISATDRARRALDLRKTGLGFQAIADELGYKDASGAYRAVASALRKTLQEPADELRRLEAERLDAMLLAIWPKVKRGNTREIDRALKIMVRRARLLGLDAPIKRELTGEVILRGMAEDVATQYGLDPALVVAEAQRILAEAGD